MGVNGATADPASGAIYLATDAGVFAGYSDLSSLGGSPHWTPMAWDCRGVPRNSGCASSDSGPPMDVMLDAQANQLWVAMDGYGVYATLAPHRYLDPRVVSAADLMARAVAPGSLISILGAQVTAVRAGDVTVPVLSTRLRRVPQLQVPFNVEGSSLALHDNRRGRQGIRAARRWRRRLPAIFVVTRMERRCCWMPTAV